MTPRATSAEEVGQYKVQVKNTVPHLDERGDQHPGHISVELGVESNLLIPLHLVLAHRLPDGHSACVALLQQLDLCEEVPLDLICKQEPCGGTEKRRGRKEGEEREKREKRDNVGEEREDEGENLNSLLFAADEHTARPPIVRHPHDSSVAFVGSNLISLIGHTAPPLPHAVAPPWDLEEEKGRGVCVKLGRLSALPRRHPPPPP